jgi:hypothetical protein
VPVLTIPLNLQNVLSLLVILVLTIIGAINIWVLSTRRHCTCKLCKKEIELEDCVGEGGFGAVYIVRKKDSNTRSVLKKLEMRDLNELEKV